MSLFNPLHHPICFEPPARVAPTAWLGHVPFAMLSIELLKPRIVVELGTHYGVSYCAFCQAVERLGTSTRLYAIDTWQGDEHAGAYGADVLADLRAHHDPLYGDFSELVQSTFDDALNRFDDGSVDLLHIDGLHTYEAVRHDYEVWLPKVSERGVIMFHDTQPRGIDFGVWRLWAELTARHPQRHFEFRHASGLGVLLAGRRWAEEASPFGDFTGPSAPLVAELFRRLGEDTTIGERLAQAEAMVHRLREQIIDFDRSPSYRLGRALTSPLRKLRARSG